ncbi:MAG TPA: tripartite tricarboxylate transporter substrate binding protein [Alphaproteobacteria bacterium]|nr:tripartite tricarboxylate transporter substrate binding protein [Alphaproteobacteria bacterium]
MKNLASLVIAGLLLSSVHASAEEAYPSRAIRIVLPFPAGGPTDVYGRLVANHLAAAWHQPVVPDNRPGATGTLGTAIVVKSPPDGYTLLMANTSSHLSPYLYKTQEYDPNTDLVPVISVVTTPYYLVSNPAFPAKTVQDLVRLIKAKPGFYSYGSPGIGSGGNMAMEMFKQMAGLNIVQVPYKGAAPEVEALMAGEVSICFDTIGNSQPHVKDGKLRGYATTGKTRSEALPHIPTMIESGYPQFEAYIWFGLFAPKGTPAPIVEKLNAEVSRYMQTPEMKKRLADLTATFDPQTPGEFKSFLVTDTKRWRDVITSTGMHLE